MIGSLDMHISNLENRLIHHVWQSLDPTLDIWSNFVKKRRKKSILPPFLKNTQFFIIHLFLWFAKDTFSFHSHHFTYPPGYPPSYLSVICPIIHWVICRSIHPVIHPVIRLVIRPVIRTVIRPVICPVIWCFPIWLTTSLSYQNADLWCEWNSDIFFKDSKYKTT